MIEYPPLLKGDAEQQTAQLRDYLIRLARELENRLKDIEEHTQEE